MPNTQPTATQKISQKWQALKNGGLDLGISQTDVLSAGYEGWYQEFEGGK